MGRFRDVLGNVRDGLRRDDRSDDRVLCAGMCLERVTGGRMSRTGETGPDRAVSFRDSGGIDARVVRPDEVFPG